MDLVNQARRENGLKELKVTSVAMDAARFRAKEVTQKVSELTGTAQERAENYSNEYAHSRLNSSNFDCWTVYKDLGYDLHIDRDTEDKYQFTNVGENVANSIHNYGYGAAKPMDVGLAHESLMNSPGHRAAILNPKFEYIGVGQSVGKDNSHRVEEFLGID